MFIFKPCEFTGQIKNTNHLNWLLDRPGHAFHLPHSPHWFSHMTRDSNLQRIYFSGLSATLPLIILTVCSSWLERSLASDLLRLSGWRLIDTDRWRNVEVICREIWLLYQWRYSSHTQTGGRESTDVILSRRFVFPHVQCYRANDWTHAKGCK